MNRPLDDNGSTTPTRKHANSRRLAEQDEDIMGKTVGTLTHRLLARCCARFGVAATATDVLKTAEDLRLDGAVHHRQALKMNSVSLVAGYFRDFRFESATFLGAEVWVGLAPVDLLWESGGLVWIDEIKTGPGAASGTRKGLELQVRAHWLAGGEEFGERFGGVRAILLDREKSSYYLDAVGVKRAGLPA